jgi:hypothetical protein
MPNRLALLAASAVAAASLAGVAQAASMNASECQAVWKKVDASGSESVTQAQAKPYVTDFKAVDTNSDGKLSSSEFNSACAKGLVQSSASGGAASGASGAGSTGTGTTGGSDKMSK